jgi:hypothetical protein
MAMMIMIDSFQLFQLLQSFRLFRFSFSIRFIERFPGRFNTFLFFVLDISEPWRGRDRGIDTPLYY